MTISAITIRMREPLTWLCRSPPSGFSSRMTDPQSFNPYAAPQVIEAPLARVVDPSEVPEVWRDGKLLVVPSGAALPWRCVKCNSPEVGLPKKQKLTWHSPWIFLGLLGGIVPFAVLALIFRKRATVQVCLCDHHRQRRRHGVWIGVVGLIFAIGLFVYGMRLPPQDSSVEVIYGASVVLGVTSLAFGVIRSQLLTAKRISKEFAWLKGCSPEFLDSLPDPPAGYQPR